MNTFLCNDLIERFGYGMAVYISAKAQAMQRSIDAVNAERKAVGAKLLQNANVEEIVGVLRRKGKLPA
jgi:Ni2+-binding GTPase involved in maturation of urease and hydrogenase